MCRGTGETVELSEEEKMLVIQKLHKVGVALCPVLVRVFTEIVVNRCCDLSFSGD
jgi:hypothetical protein